MKHLYAVIALLLSIASYSQHCPELGPDQVLPCGVGSTTLTADLSQCGGGGVNPKQTTTYQVASIPYVAQNNTGTQLFMTDDSQQGPFAIGFNFCFFGQTYTQFWVGSNGWISFSPGQSTTFTSQPIPSVAFNVPKNCIMGPWQDWHPGIGGQIRYQVQGVAPCRRLVVSWIGVPMYSCTGNQGTFHIVIYESTNVIENHIANKPACLQWQGGTATEGVHNAAGNIGITVPGRNSTAWTATNDAWRWTPNGAPVMPMLVWYQVGVAAPLGTGPSLTVNPPVGGAQYTCHLEYPTCNVGWNTCNANGQALGPDTVLVVPGPAVPVVSPINGLDTICYDPYAPVVSSNYNVVLDPNYTYTWSSVGNIYSGQGTNEIFVDWAGFPTGLITTAVQVFPSAFGCVGAPVTFDLVILNIDPTIDPIGPFCEYDEFVTVNVTPTGGALSGLGVSGYEFYPANAVGTNQLYYGYTQSGCLFDTTIDVIVYPQPTLDSITPYNPFYEICEGDSVITTFNAISNLPGYNEWSYMGSTYQQDDITISFNATGQFPLSVVHYSNGCISPQQQTIITVAVCPELLFYIPNSFTPDGNEHNQTWLPVFTTGIDVFSYHLQVYNRWGECVFESHNANEGWDGTHNIYNCQDGVYTYTVQFTEKNSAHEYVINGHFSLIR